LLTLSGCELGNVPNIDVLKNMITYLAPFVQGLGFSKVLEHVTTTCQKQLLRSYKDVTGLVACGESRILAGVIYQLCLIAQREESIYLVVRQRGAWIASFASYLLGLSVEVLLEDTVLWESAGRNGKVSLQLATDFTSSRGVERHGHLTLSLVPEPIDSSGREPLVIYYDPATALNTELSQIPEIPTARYPGIQTAIVRLCLVVIEELCVSEFAIGLESKPSSTLPSSRLGLLSEQPTTRLLSVFGIPDQLIAIGKKDFRTYRSRIKVRGYGSRAHGFYYLDSDQKSWLRSACSSTICMQANLEKLGELRSCLCGRVGKIIVGYASTILALGQCVADAPDLRLRADVLNGSVRTKWLHELVLSADLIRNIIGHLGQLLTWSLSDVDDGIERLFKSSQGGSCVLGVSADAYTIAYTALLSDEAFDNYGRMLTITSGRATVDGLFRNYLLERMVDPSIPKEDPPPLLAPGSFIEPHYYPGRLQVWIETGVVEEGVIVGTFVGHGQETTGISLSMCAAEMKRVVVTRCEHSKTRPYRVPHSCHQPNNTNQPLPHWILPFGYVYTYGTSWLYHSLGIVIFPLKGNRLHQLIQCGLLRRERRSVTLQINSCIACALRKTDHIHGLILGG